MRVAVGLAIAMAVGVWPGAAAAAPVPPLDSVSGSGTTTAGATFDIWITEPVGAEGSSQHFTLTGIEPGSYNLEAIPRCINTAADRATLGFVIKSGSVVGGATDLSGQGVVLWVQNKWAHGTLYYKVIGRNEPITCPDPRPGPASSLSPLEFWGNTYVFDGQPRIPAGSDSVSGSASACASRDINQVCTDGVWINLDLASGFEGQAPYGAVYVDYDGTTPSSTSHIRAAVTCLSVTDHAAIVGVTASRIRAGERNTQLAGLVRIVDLGGPDTGADRFEFALREGPLDGPPLAGPSSCSSFPGPFPIGGAPTFTNEKGNVVVTDTHPPSTYAQCRLAGWVNYGFTNRATCIAYVHDVARRKCIFERVAKGLAAFRSKYGRGVSQEYAMRRCVRAYTGP